MSDEQKTEPTGETVPCAGWCGQAVPVGEVEMIWTPHLVDGKKVHRRDPYCGRCAVRELTSRLDQIGKGVREMREGQRVPSLEEVVRGR